MSTAITQAAAAIGQINFVEIATNIQKHRADIDEFEAAIGRAFARQAEINEELQGHKNLDVTALADALMDGDVLAAVRPDVEALHDERASLQHGVGELRRRIANSRMQADDAKNGAKRSAGLKLDDVAAELESEAVALASRMAQIYAVSSALGRAAPSAPMQSLTRKLEPVLVDRI